MNKAFDDGSLRPFMMILTMMEFIVVECKLLLMKILKLS